MNEQDYKKYIDEKVEQVKTKEQLYALLDEVVNGQFDYGTIVWAICGCMKATMNYIDRSKVGGITGFQASIIGWEIFKEYTYLKNNESGSRVIDFDDMLFPQHEEEFEKNISAETWEILQKQAKEKLENCKYAHPKVIKHWKKIVNGKVPFGYKVR